MTEKQKNRTLVHRVESAAFLRRQMAHAHAADFEARGLNGVDNFSDMRHCVRLDHRERPLRTAGVVRFRRGVRVAHDLGHCSVFVTDVLMQFEGGESDKSLMAHSNFGEFFVS